MANVHSQSKEEQVCSTFDTFTYQYLFIYWPLRATKILYRFENNNDTVEKQTTQRKINVILRLLFLFFSSEEFQYYHILKSLYVVLFIEEVAKSLSPTLDLVF